MPGCIDHVADSCWPYMILTQCLVCCRRPDRVGGSQDVVPDPSGMVNLSCVLDQGAWDHSLGYRATVSVR